MLVYNYSPIKSIKIKNFRNIGDIDLDFSESPIISLIGENESGKTSVVKAFGVCAAHQTPRSQKDYIRDGTLGFGVAIELQDGTMITRMKTTTANVYRVTNPDGTVWEAQKLESVVPKAVSDVMGLIEERETKELLQIRTYEDQLLFVITPASTNYRVMYDALKISQITRAIKAGNAEANELKAKINSAEGSIGTLENSLRDIRIFDLTPALNIKNKIISSMSILDSLDRAMDISEDIRVQKAQLGSMSAIAEAGLKEINEYTVQLVNSASRVLSDLDKSTNSVKLYDSVANLEDVDIELAGKILSIQGRVESLNAARASAGAFVNLCSAEQIDENTLTMLNRAMTVHTSLARDKQALAAIDTSSINPITDDTLGYLGKMQKIVEIESENKTNAGYIEQINTYVNQIIQWMKSIGVATTDCPRCGESVIIDVSILENN